MNGYYAEQNAIEALRLAKENADELKSTKEVVKLLIEWLEMDLGSETTMKLIDKLSMHNV